MGEGQGADPVSMPSQAAHLLEGLGAHPQQQADAAVHPSHSHHHTAGVQQSLTLVWKTSQQSFTMLWE